jgi:hypothetical protein
VGFAAGVAAAPRASRRPSATNSADASTSKARPAMLARPAFRDVDGPAVQAAHGFSHARFTTSARKGRAAVIDPTSDGVAADSSTREPKPKIKSKLQTRAPSDGKSARASNIAKQRHTKLLRLLEGGRKLGEKFRLVL